MKNLMVLTLLLIFVAGCKSECKEVPVKDVHEMTDEEIKKEVF
jgi:PBP1b-binding outer membrane lipoprotein LpoB